MERTTSTKKIALAAILTSGIALAISQSAMAQNQPDPQGPDKTPGYRQMDPVMIKAHDKFLAETVDLRKQMTEKQAMMRAIMQADEPNTTQAGQVAGELFELREKLRVKAQEAGLPGSMMGMGMGSGMGMHGWGCDFGDGMGRGHGMGPHRSNRR
ncbi:MAG: hypothetical protein RBT36_00390 [Desulfobulbus sp.]|jgi:zinc resistance-associated protein|nr:hypothetical protein [Desulfobulbus sp.]